MCHVERDLALGQRGKDRLGQVSEAQPALDMADRNAETAGHGLRVSARGDDIVIGPRLVCRGHRFAEEVFSKADLAGGGVLIFAQAHVDGVILGQDAAFDQQADGAPAPAARVDIKEGLFAR